jgi:tetratricopeptide (TPR) repeat protein
MKLPLASLFWKGLISAAISGYEHLAAKKTRSSKSQILAQISEIIGSYVFSGELDQAKLVFETYSPDLESAQTAGCVFFLLVGEVRNSAYAAADKLLAQLQTNASANLDSPLTQFYSYQAEAFSCFYRSDYEQARNAAAKAATISYGIAFTFGELIARDMLGGSLEQIGEISLAIKEFGRALAAATSLGHGSFAAASLISLTCLKVKFGYVKNPLRLLKATLTHVKPEDTYSTSSLKLEIVRQYLLRGQIKDAEEVLQECSEMIYASQNLRQTFDLHLRWSFLMYCRGQYHQALTFIQVAERSLDKKTDQHSLAKLFGLRLKTMSMLNMPVPVNHNYHGDSTNSRIVNRHSQAFVPAKAGEDKIADVIDVIAQGTKKSALAAIVKSEAWYFLADVLDLKRQKSYLILGVDKPGSLTVLHEGEVYHPRREIGGYQFKLLRLIAISPQTKQAIVESVWEYRYSPERHDGIVYSTVSALRRLLGEFGSWIEMDDDRYRLNSEVTLLMLQAQPLEPDTARAEIPGAQIIPSGQMSTSFDNLPFKVELNFRQNNWVFNQSIRINPFGITDYRKFFSISTMTAFRDIHGLIELGYLKRTGYGRATRYYFEKNC